MTKIGQELFEIGKELTSLTPRDLLELDHFRYSAHEETNGALLLKFKIYDHYRGNLITSGINPHLTEREQVIYALELAKQRPEDVTLHLYPLGKDRGLFFVRPWSYQLLEERQGSITVYADSATRQEACWDDWLRAKHYHRWPTRRDDGTYYLPSKKYHPFR